MSTPSIVVIGHVCIDYNKSERASYTSWGSSVLYIARSFQKQFGANPLAITNYGPDLLPYLPPVTIYPAVPNQPYSLIFENDSSRGKRTQKCHNAGYAGPPELTEEVIDAIKRADIVIVALLLSNYPADYVQELLQYCKQGALKVLCPQGYFRNITDDERIEPREFVEAEAIFPLFDLVVYSEEDSPVAFELAKRIKQTADNTDIIVTQSADGATIVGKDSDQHIPTTPIAPEDIVDSVGCGDTFDAAVTYSYYLSKNLPAAVRDAHQAAARKLLTIPGKD